MGTKQGNGEHPHRYVIMNGKLWRISYSQYVRALEMAKESNSAQVTIDPGRFRMIEVDGIPANWTKLSSAEAEALLMGVSTQTANRVQAEQSRIEKGASGLPETPTEAARGVIRAGEGDASEAEQIGQDEYQNATTG